MKIGILVEPVERLDWQRWRAIYLAAERLGFESVWVSDHLASTWFPENHGLDPWVALTMAAAETRRVHLGPLVSPITFRQPALVARMAEAIDDLSSGRFVLGLGLGWNADVDLYRERAHRLAELCDELGRDPNTIRRSVAVGCMIGRDVADLHERGQRLQRLVPPLAAAVKRAGSLVEAAGTLGWVAGTPAQIVAALRPLAAAGVELAILGQYDHTDQAALELIASEVMPALQ